MKLTVGIVLGSLITLLVLAAIGFASVTNGWIPGAADGPMLPMESWAAHHDLNAVLGREANDHSPLPADYDNLLAGSKIYASNCGGCHGTPVDKSPGFAKGFTPGPTLFAAGDMVTDDPEGWIYWKIRHGIKWTGMPAFSKILSDKEMWQVTLFLKNMDKLPPKVQVVWDAMK